MKRIIWLSTGGTIACQATDKGLMPDNSVLMMEKMLSELPQIKDTEITCHEIMNKDSTNITAGDWRKIADEIYKYMSEADGFVITHGTDTMAYTASVLHFMLKNIPLPVIITGSQHPFFSKNTDARKNLKDSFIAASEGSLQGVFIVFSEKIIPAVYSKKVCAKNTEAFVSVTNYTGEINDGIVKIYDRVIPKGGFEYKNKLCENVQLIHLTPSMKPDMLDYFENTGCKGIVLMCYGVGGIPSENGILKKLSQLISKGIRVVAVSQCLYDGIDLSVYEVGEKARAIEIESGERLTPEGALAKLMVEISE